MKHSEFVQMWRDGNLEISVNSTKALAIANSKALPMRYRFAHISLSWIWMLSIPVAFVIMYFYAWWVGLLSLFIVTPIIKSGN